MTAMGTVERQEADIRVPRGLGHEPALDGLRALAVLAVIAYHAGAHWLPGGFLGVDVFFVVSGYLITALLVQEWGTSGRIDLRGFWKRRARRLLPALYVTLVVTTLAAAVLARDALAELRDDLVAALTYTTNWWLIFSRQSYFEAAGRPSLLRHLWSLAVEEQWYLLWPLVFVGGLRLARGRSHRLLVPILLAAVASAVWMAILFQPDADPSRVYYGTDTRAAGLLLGAALALVWSPWRSQARVARPRRALDALGWLALGVLGWACWHFDQFAPTLYRGGFFVVAVVAAAAVAVAVHPGARSYRAALGAPLLVWIGVRSYGLYLFHWPVFMLLTPQDVGVSGTPLLVLRLGVTLALAVLSYRLVEQPIRSGAPARWRSRFRTAAPGERVAMTAHWRLALLAVALLGGSLVVRVATAPAFDPITGEARAATSDTTQQPTRVVTSLQRSVPIAPTVAPPAPVPSDAVALPAPASPPTTVVLPVKVAVVGDSQAHTLVVNAPSTIGSTLQLTNGAVLGCGIVDEGSMRSAAHARRSFGGCAGWADRWAKSATDADVALVVIGAWEVFDLRVGNTTWAFGSPEHQAYLRAQLDHGIANLLAAGAKVALLEVPCYRPVDTGGQPALPERGDDARTRLLNTILKDAAAADPAHVRFVPGPTAWCTDESVARDLGDRWDGVHYYKPGAARVFDAITKNLVAISSL